MKQWAVCVSLVALVVGSAQVAAAQGGTGKELYAKKCGTCHGDKGEGKPAVAKMLKIEFRHLGSKEVQTQSNEDLNKVIIKGIEKMKPAGVDEADQRGRLRVPWPSRAALADRPRQSRLLPPNPPDWWTAFGLGGRPSACGRGRGLDRIHAHPVKARAGRASSRRPAPAPEAGAPRSDEPRSSEERSMASRARTEFRYEKLTVEITDAVELGKVCILPCGSVEQHAPHLPLDTTSLPAGDRPGPGASSDRSSSCPHGYGYTGHVMDFPGTITPLRDLHPPRPRRHQVTVTTVWILLLNGHGSNMPNLDLVARRTNLETDAECVLAAWWSLLTVDREFLPRWRQSEFPGGCAHACELETSLYLYLDGDNVRKDQIKSGLASYTHEHSPFFLVDLFGAGPAPVISWTSSYTETGVVGAAELATAEKGREAYEEAVRQLLRFVDWFRERPADARQDHHRRAPTMPMPWGQTPVKH
jgi:creatinine amidohydrolase